MINQDISNLQILNEEERKIAKKLFDEYYIKIQRLIKNSFSLKVHFKEHEKEGQRRKITISVEVISLGKIFNAKAFDWDLARAIHKVLNKILNKIEHAYHSSEQK